MPYYRLPDVDLPVMTAMYVKDNRYDFDLIRKVEEECAALCLDEGYNLSERTIAKYAFYYVTHIKGK